MDKFTITRTYDRDVLLAEAEKIKKMDGSLSQARTYLDLMYVGWSLNTRASLMIELVFREAGDIFFDVFTEKLAELDNIEGEFFNNGE